VTADCEAMELTVRPADLAAAALALAGFSGFLEDAVLTFEQQARADIPQIGAELAEATIRGSRTIIHGVAILTRDIDRIENALTSLAGYYPNLDGTAVSGRTPSRR
jgi:hypothetical protein